MKHRIAAVLTVFLALALSATAAASAGDAAPTGSSTSATPTVDTKDPVALMTASQKAFLYVEKDMKVRIDMQLIDKSGKQREKVMTMLRCNVANSDDQKYFIYFQKPGDIRGMTFMVWKHPGKEDERWLYISSIDMVKRIAANDSRSSFVGSDFTYEDVSGRDIAADTHKLLKEEKLGDRDCYVVESTPKSAVEYARKLTWIDAQNFLPLKEEYYNAQNELFRVFTADKVEELPVGASDPARKVPTITHRTMKNLKTGHSTEITFSEVSYDNGLKEEDFNERHLRTPPHEWTN
ncbi:MAG: outer membrane lipoprotein-sorting protein [Planctomycetota bacterium]